MIITIETGDSRSKMRFVVKVQIHSENVILVIVKGKLFCKYFSEPVRVENGLKMYLWLLSIKIRK